MVNIEYWLDSSEILKENITQYVLPLPGDGKTYLFNKV